MIEDFADAGAVGDIECDVCIVGSGPVGIAIALQFAGSGTRVVLLESGGDAYEPDAEALSLFENSGHRRADPGAIRRRLFGGTSSVWSGRCMAFSPLDLQPRPWMPCSGWPLQEDELRPWLEKAATFLNAGPFVSNARVWRLLGVVPPALWNPESFESQVFQASVASHQRTRSIAPPVDQSAASLGALNHSGAPVAEDLAEVSRERLAAATNIRLLLHAHALEVTSEGGRATGVMIGSLRGATGRVRARDVVLACGGIDNARLLLLSSKEEKAGLGNRHDQVGRYLTDHHYAPIAHLDGRAASALRRRLSQRWFDWKGVRHVYGQGASLSAQRQREHGLPRATVFLFEHHTRIAAITAARRIATGLAGRTPGPTGADWKAALTHPVELTQGLVDRYVFRRPSLSPVSRVDIGCNVEQIPDADSRVTLGERRDAFGQPLARLDWRLSDREYHTYQTTAHLFAAECARLGFGRLQLADWLSAPGPDWRAALHDMAHPMCTTRMSSDPRQGVVDSHCEVHGTAGLHIAGSSVFSTGGTSNPTLMAVALGLRLADRIQRRVQERAASTGVLPSVSPVVSGGRSRVRIGLVGAGDRIQHIYAPVLAALSAEIEVCGFHSRSAQSRARLAAHTGWTGYDSLPSLLEQMPDALVVAVSPGANVGVLHHALTAGRPVLAETPLAWDERSARALVAHARARGVALGVTEQFPFFPAECLKRKLIDMGAIGAVHAVINDFATFDYHGIAQLRAYLGPDVAPRRARAWRHDFGRTGTPLGKDPVMPEFGWPEDWLAGVVEMHGGALLIQNFSAGYATLPTRPPGELRVLGSSGSLVGDRLVFADRVTNMRGEAAFERDSAGVRVVHPVFGVVEWRSAPHLAALPDELQAVAAHVEALVRVVRDGAAPLYLAEEACEDIEILRALRLSADGGGGRVTLPIGRILPRARVAMHRALSKVSGGQR